MRRIGFKSAENDKGDGAELLAAASPGHTRRATLFVGSLGAVLAAGASLTAAGAFAPPKPATPPDPPVPTIAARPADPSSQTSAHFTYTDGQSGASFQCQLDGSSFAACPANGITYAGPLPQGSHTFRVRALTGSKSGASNSWTWTVDTTAPTASISHPTDGRTLSSADWGAGCPAHASICGTAKDAHGVRSVALSIQRGASNWWGGGAFDQHSESFRTATLASVQRDKTRWSYVLHLPADGLYTVHVRATDDAGNTTSSARQASARFTIDTTPPPAPTITSEPNATTTARSATFAFADAEHGARLQCRRDAARFTRCASPRSYTSLSFGPHRFEVEATDAVGNASAPTGYSWTVVKSVETSGKPFTVTGNASGPLAPGLSRILAIRLANPNNVPIEVTALSVSVAAASSNAGCDGPTNLQLTQSNVSSANPLAIAADASIALPTGAVSAPAVLMRDLPVNQDPCKNASFTFTYSGSAHS